MIRNYELMIDCLALGVDPDVEAARIKNTQAQDKFDRLPEFPVTSIRTFTLATGYINEAQRLYVKAMHNQLAKSGYFGRENVDENNKPVSPFLDKFKKRYVAEGVYELMDEKQPARLNLDRWVEHLNEQEWEKLQERYAQIDHAHGVVSPELAVNLKETARLDAEQNIRDRNRDHLNSKLQPLEVKDAEVDEVDIQVLKALTDALVSLTRVLDNMAGTTLVPKPVPNPEVI